MSREENKAFLKLMDIFFFVRELFIMLGKALATSLTFVFIVTFVLAVVLVLHAYITDAIVVATINVM